MRLKGKRILISAAAQGIGRASALACAAEGAHVIATDIDVEALAKLAAENQHIETHQLDVRDSAAVASFAGLQNALDGLFNCAGFVHNGSILDCDEADWDFSFDLNVKSMYRTVQAFLPGMLEQAGKTGRRRHSQHGLDGLVDQRLPQPFRLLRHQGRRGRAHQGDCCGLREREPSLQRALPRHGRHAFASRQDRRRRRPVQAEKDFIARQPMGRLATVDDITPLVVYPAFGRISLRDRPGHPRRWRRDDLMEAARAKFGIEARRRCGLVRQAPTCVRNVRAGMARETAR